LHLTDGRIKVFLFFGFCCWHSADNFSFQEQTVEGFPMYQQTFGLVTLGDFRSACEYIELAVDVEWKYSYNQMNQRVVCYPARGDYVAGEKK
jgi:hypothetical protein